MANATVSQHPAGGSFRWARVSAYLFIAAFAVYFYLEYATRYFVWSEDSYGAYYWGKRVALAFHLAGGSLALVLGLPQFWMGFRNRYMRIHRLSGRLYVSGVLVGSIGAFMMATAPEQSLGFGFAFALFALGIAWVVTTGAAFYAILRRNFRQHRDWMIRSYIVTLAFVTFRVLSDWVPYQDWGVDVADYNTAMMWSCWVFPLLIAEVVLQFRSR